MQCGHGRGRALPLGFEANLTGGRWGYPLILAYVDTYISVIYTWEGVPLS